MLDHYSSLFQEGLGILKQTKVKFFLKEGVTLKFYKARPVLLGLQQQVTAAYKLKVFFVQSKCQTGQRP